MLALIDLFTFFLNKSYVSTHMESTFLLGILLFFILCGAPIGFTLILIPFFYILITDAVPLVLIPSQMFNAIDSVPLTAIAFLC